MLKFFIPVLLIFLLSGCETTAPQEQNAVSLSNHEHRDLHLLIFKKEKKLEVWNTTHKQELLFAVKIQLSEFLPLGMFDLEIDAISKSARIDFPGEFYKNKNYDHNFKENIVLTLDDLPLAFFNQRDSTIFSKIIIFPNDNRTGGELEPCFACPHWMAEIYSFLELVKKKYI